MKYIGKKFIVVTVIACGMTWALPAHSIPAFARKHDLNCSACHSAYPQLNATGREYKENGYRFDSASDADDMAVISDFLQLDKSTPLSLILVARPYDKTDSGNEKIRALHEIEIIGASAIGKNWSGYLEIEAEDETGFEPELAAAVLSYNHSKEFNVQMVYGSQFWADSYGILNDHFRLTRGHVGAIDQRFGGADGGGRFRSNKQTVGVFGRVSDRFFYNVNYSGVAGDPEGENASTISGLFNVDITDNFMAGVFAMDGQDEATNRDFSRTGLQFQADLTDLRLQGLYIAGTDDRDPLDIRGPGEDDNDAFSLQAIYTVINDSLRPTWTPLVRFDRYETNDGADSFSELTLNIGYYFTQNIKGYIEYWDRFDTPTSVPEDNRITLQVVAAF